MKIPMTLLVLLFIGCGDKDTGADTSEGADGVSAAADIEVSPETVDFGELSVTDGESLSSVITISNTGGAELYINDVSITGDDRGVYTLSTLSSASVDGGSAITLTLTYTPSTAAEDAATLTISSTDPDQPTVDVPISGTGIAPVLAVEPESLSLGAVPIGCDVTEEITISNTGSADLTISSLAVSADSDELIIDEAAFADTYGAPPWTLSPGASAMLSVSYAPLDAGADSATITVESDDPLTPTLVTTIGGEADKTDSQSDAFTFVATPQVDLLMAVDTHDGEDEESYLADIAGGFTPFVSALNGEDLDYRIFVVTDDDGCITSKPSYIDADTSANNAEDVLTGMWPTAAPDEPEQGLARVESALLADYIDKKFGDGCNVDLFRPDADLHVLGVSNEADASPKSYDLYLSGMHNLRPDGKVLVHAIGGPSPEGCEGADYYSGFYEATSDSGGAFYSICDSMRDSLESLASYIGAQKLRFDLLSTPVEATLSVSIAGVSSSQWSYDASANAVLLSSDADIVDGDDVEISYVTATECAR